LALTGKGWFGVQVTHGEELGLEKPERRQKDGVRKIFCIHFQQIFFIFFYLHLPSAAFIDLHSPSLERLQKGSFWSNSPGWRGGD
jgi:hypothetical protein